MANAERGELALMVEGVSYTLRPTFDALCELEAQVDAPINAVLQTVMEGRLSGLRAVVWALLQDSHAKEIRTLKDASRWIERAGGGDVVLDAVYKVFRLNIDEAIESSAANPQPAQAGTSASSSSTPVESA